MAHSKKEELWIEKIASITNLEKLGEKIGVKGFGPYLYLWIFYFINTVILEYFIFFREPPYPPVSHVIGYAIPAVVGFTFAVWATRKLRNELHNTLENFNFNIRSDIFRFKIILYILGSLVVGTWMMVQAGLIPNPLTGEYVSRKILHFTLPELLRYSIWFFGYLIIVVEGGAYYIGINLLLPWKIEKNDIDPSDTHRYGGMKEVGNLILKSAQFYFIGLSLVTLTNYQAFEPIFTKIGLMLFSFIITWIVGLSLFLLPSFWIHLQIKSRKEDLLDELNGKIRDAGREPGGRLEVKPNDPDEMLEYIFQYLEHEHVHSMREYPIDASIIQQLIFSAIIPISLQLTLSFLF